MAKKTEHQRIARIDHPQGQGSSYEKHTSVDDSLLPDAIELEKLKILDPTIMDWIKERTAKEQDGRLYFNQKKIEIFCLNT